MQIIRRTAPAAKPILYEIENEEYPYKPITKRLATFDTETDPFLEGREPRPFTCGFYLIDEDKYWDFWGDDCIAQFFEFLDHNFVEDELLILCHNGGNFDFYFLTEYFDEGMKPFIMNGRLVRIIAHSQEFRDSYSMVPVALGNALKAEDGGKIEIDYTKLERDVRHLHKEEICKYQKQDCIALAKLVSEWYEMFGDKLTMASVALPMLRSYHGFENMSEDTDHAMRPYYFGGRCQAFETGELFPSDNSDGFFYIYDVNSMYPSVMKDYLHPISSTPVYGKKLDDKYHFAKIRAWSNGALPIRLDTGGLDFPIGVRDYYATRHEIEAGLETGLLRIHSIYETVTFSHSTSFDEFIDTFYKLRMEAGDNGDEVKKLFYKLVMNSSYGKFAQDPRKYENYVFDPVEVPTPFYCAPCHERIMKRLAKVECPTCESKTHSPYGWFLHTERDGRFIYARPNQIRNGSGFFNVATAASITGAARAMLLRGLHQATRPIYCDTDSIICEAFSGDTDSKRLGAWKPEDEADMFAIAGKKLYAGFLNGECIKKASKGVKLTGEEIRSIALGDVIKYCSPVPKFSILKEVNSTGAYNEQGVGVEWINRNVRATG